MDHTLTKKNNALSVFHHIRRFGPSPPGWLLRSANWIKWISLAVAVAALVVLVRQLPTDQAIQWVTGSVQGLGVWGYVIFGAVYVVAAVLFVPGSVLSLAAGAMFGLLWGTVTVSIASTTAAAIAFLIARYLARDSVRQWAKRYPKFAAVDRAIGEQGWKIVALLRLSPVVPYSVSNYLYGLTAVRFVPYVLTTWLAMLPGTFLYIYIGYAGRAGLAAASGGESGRGPWEWTLLGVGLAATIAVTIYVTRLARRAIAEQTQIEASGDESGPDRAPPATEDRQESNGGTEQTRSWPWGALAAAAFALVMVILAGCAYAKQDALASLFGPPQATMKEAYEPDPGPPNFDHSLFTQVVQEHVRPGGWVDYQGLEQDHQKLDKYIKQLAKAPFDQLGRDEKLALLINAYNAFTLKLILEHYPGIDSIKDIPAAQRWEAERWEIGSHTWSLNQIEHQQIRAKFIEPRIHFALVCAAVGCPPLRREAYTAERIDAQLADQAEYVHNHPRWFRYKPGSGEVHLTKLYDWYGGDFEQVAGSVLQFAARYAPQLARALKAGRQPEIQWLPYDWSLNSIANKR